MNNGLQQGEATLSYYEQILAGYSDSIAPQSAVSNTGWLLLGAGALVAAVLVLTK